jgi:hypothetical protein
MRLWLLERPTGDADYGEHESAVVRAETEGEARNLASEDLLPHQIWLGPGVTCRPLDADGAPGIVISSFNAG